MHGHAWGVRCTVGRSVLPAGGRCIWALRAHDHRDHMCARSAARAACGCEGVWAVFAHSVVLAATGVAGCTRLISVLRSVRESCTGAAALAGPRMHMHAHAHTHTHT